MPKSNKEKAISGFLWLGFEKGIGYVLTLVITMILARLLTPKDFGVVAALQIVISFADIFSMLGLGSAIIQKKEVTDEDIITANILNIFLGVLVYGIIFLFSSLIASFVGIGNIGMLKIMASVFLLHSLSGISSSLLRKEMRFKNLSFIYLAGQGSYGIITITLALMGFGPWSLIVGRLMMTTTSTILKLWLMPMKIKPKINWISAKELLGFGSGMTLTRVFNNAALEGDNWVASRFLGATKLGFYSKAYTLFQMPTSIFGSILNSVLFPLLSKYQDRHKKIAYVYLNLNAVLALLTLPATIFLFLSASEIVNFILGDGWQPVVAPFKILVICLFFRTSYKISVSTINSLGAIYRRMWTQILYASTVIGGGLIGKEWGIVGIAAATSIGMVINYLVLSLLVRKLIEFKLSDLKNYLLPIVMVNIVLAPLSYALYFVLSGFQSEIVRTIILALSIGVFYLMAYKFIILKWMPAEFKEFVTTILNNTINRPLSIIKGRA